MKWERICSQCGSTVYHKSKKVRNRENKKKSMCKSCSNRLIPRGWVLNPNLQKSLKTRKKNNYHHSEETKQKIRISKLGSKNPMASGLTDEHKRKISQTLKDRPVTWGDKISKSLKKFHKKRREENAQIIPKKHQYNLHIRRITKQQPIHLLENYEKRGRAGQIGVYQLDHIISKNYGFKNNILPEIIGEISNLRMIPWQENLKKGDR